MKKKTLSQAFVEILFNISGSKDSTKWKGTLKKRYIITINSPYSIALNEELDCAVLFVKNETVSGIIGKTQGVSRANKPPKNPRINKSK